MARADDGKLSNQQIGELGASSFISTANLESVAQRYLFLKPETLATLREEYRGNSEAYRREIFIRWKNMHANGHQRKVLCMLVALAFVSEGQQFLTVGLVFGFLRFMIMSFRQIKILVSLFLFATSSSA